MDYSLVVCVYNPDVRILERCLRAISRLEIDGLETEVIISDNNSEIPVGSLSCLEQYAERLPNLQIIYVKEQGVKYARMAAIDVAKGKQVVYIDYDNEPAADYLQQLRMLNRQYPQVAAWGPGNVWVDFIDGIDNSIADYARVAFQEHHATRLEYSQQREWQECYPYGTGLCTYTFLLKEYNRIAREGGFTMAGRSGNRLTSGEDTQMVMLCISKGYAAGISPALRLNHVIPGNRSNVPYLKRMAYGTSFCYGTCMLQVFPDYMDTLRHEILSPSKFSGQLLSRYIEARRSSSPLKTFELAKFIGMQAGKYVAINKPIPFIVQRITRILQLE